MASSTSRWAASVSPAPGTAEPPGPRADDRESAAGVRQEFTASDGARQAVLGMGTQNVYIDGGRPAAVAVSVAPPFGQRDEARPVRGRAGVLADLADDDTAPAGVRILHGLGGCGKTRLALEAAFAAQEAGAQVWWVSAADPGVLEAGMHAVGRRLGLAQADLEHGDAADLIWQRLAACPQRWMLVLDNADDPPILAGPGASVREGRGWLRPVTGQAGTVLVTSRDGAGATWGPWCRRLPLGMLPADQAAEVLADYARRRGGLGDEQDARARRWPAGCGSWARITLPRSSHSAISRSSRSSGPTRSAAGSAGRHSGDGQRELAGLAPRA